MRRSFLLLSMVGVAACAHGADVGGGGSGAGGSSDSTSVASSGSSAGEGPPTAGAGTSTSTSGSGGGLADDACPTDQFATGVDAAGKLTCARIDAAAADAINQGCALYLGWSDACTGCGTMAKWGRASGVSCSNGVGSNASCTNPSLDGTTVNLFGLNTDGDVDDNDTFYAGFYCQSGTSETESGPCGAGKLATSVGEGNVTCTNVESAVLGYMRANCAVYLGWRDSCDSCSLAPTKWASASSLTCDSGLGVDNTCITPTLGLDAVPMLGLNTDGDVNDDDKFYVGMHCDEPASAGGPAMGECPAGQFVVGTHADGSLECDSPAPLVANYARAHCSITFGWIDTCDGCISVPGKWGKVQDGGCTPGVGANDTCSVASLDGANVDLFGLNPDGNVNDDDKFFVGFSCN